MNYFELFGIPRSLSVDTKKINGKYLSLQKKYHPDFFSQADELEKAHALERSALVNLAWTTFQSKDETVRYVLELEGLLEDEGKFRLPPDFLSAVMDLNEMKMDGMETEAIRAKVLELQEATEKKLEHLWVKSSDEEYSREDLQQVKEWYYKKKYLDRLLSE